MTWIPDDSARGGTAFVVFRGAAKRRRGAAAQLPLLLDPPRAGRPWSLELEGLDARRA
jgi:hypothetical protein